MLSFAETVAALAGTGPHDWSLPAVAAWLGRAGVTVAPTATGRFETTPLAGAHIDVVNDPDAREPSAPGAVYGVGLTPVDGDLAAAAQAVRAALGPPPVLGGPGPWLRWPAADLWWTLARSATTGTVRLFVEPAARAADDEQRDMDFSTLAALPYLWRVDDESLVPAGGWRPAARPVRNHEALGRQFAAVLSSLTQARHELPDCTPDVTVVVGTRRGRDEVRCRLDADGLAVQHGGRWTDHPATEVGSRAAAAACADAIRSWGPRIADEPGKRLRETSFAAQGLLSLPGLGVPRGR